MGKLDGSAGSVTVRRAQPHDRAFLEAMAAVAVNWDPDRAAVSAETIAADPTLRRYVVGWARTNDLGVIAEAAGAPVGAAWLRAFDAAEPGYGFIADGIPELTIGVTAAWRGRGIGGRLLDALVDSARPGGIRAISLSVERANPARRLYERHGFRDVKDDGAAVTMRLDLEPPSQVPGGHSSRK